MQAQLDQQTAVERQKLIARLFPSGIPPLWCPLLTHYDEAGAIDQARMKAHLQHLAPAVKGYLLPGSTGDGWELTPSERQTVIDLVLGQAPTLGFQVLVGILKKDTTAALSEVREILDRFKTRTRTKETDDCLAALRICGFTVCPPTGKDLSQEEIKRALVAILEEKLPIALYQLPQVTQNEMSPELVSELAARFSNFYLLKDTSGGDRVALSQNKLDHIFLVRGAEGDYLRWLIYGGGPYHGLLLSTANCFGHQFAEMIDRVKAGRTAEAQRLSDQVSGIVKEAFQLVSTVNDGNPFANANKAIDHFFAHGPKASSVPPPRLHAGSRLPVAVIRATGEALTRHQLMPPKGYLE